MAIEPGPQFYHGTHVDLNPGDIIQPRNTMKDAKPNFRPEPGFNQGDRAYATDNPASALFYGINSAEVNKRGFHAAKVYHVEPVDHKDLETDKEGSIVNGNAFSSRSGFRVVKRHERERK